MPTIVVNAGGAIASGSSHGRRSRNEDGAAAVARLLSRAEVRTLPNAGHDPWFSRPDLFFPAVESFLAGQAASGGS
jgi:pimeloyl-ACP methyl ester carboxylesterase